MREVLPELLRWWKAGHTVGVGTVVATFRSAPQPPGASMVVGPDGAAFGSVSGGCVEGAVYDLCTSTAETGDRVLERYGVTDDDALAVGLTCGGILDVFVDAVSPTTFPELADVAADLGAERPVAVATVIAHPDSSRVGRRLVIRESGVTGTLGSARADSAVHDDAIGLLAAGHHSTLSYGPDGERLGDEMKVFVWAFTPPPRMIVFGAIDFAAAVARVGSFLRYRVTVCDARPVFATASRFPHADEVVVDWPHRYLAGEAAAGRIDRRTVLCVLTHDPKFDVPVLDVALRLTGDAQPCYIGAMGSRRTHADRLLRLREVGLEADHLARLSSPIGLDLGARTAEETAVSVAAEIIAHRWGGSGRSLATTSGRIHGETANDDGLRSEPGSANVPASGS
ncbi:XshC-Cox1 family protein [Gordonia sp. HNM0687]|uniref:XshC-Cox1 family protein n=1 Tax=Gordonia mangrovi TaxID=2665643 RepID=A0A6L7GXS6_9ACTN|nr:XdhC/CoxI family protein [Gordonia mangrovi]MXP23418.1 XshC-Cox1 family protein [Gordonia mangrovi]UVF76682.1 XdhC family protein [Gordonia mangrovi]